MRETASCRGSDVSNGVMVNVGVVEGLMVMEVLDGLSERRFETACPDFSLFFGGPGGEGEGSAGSGCIKVKIGRFLVAQIYWLSIIPRVN